MRVLGLIVVACALAMVVTHKWLNRSSAELPREGIGMYRVVTIPVTGTGNTLANLAEKVNDPMRMTYDPTTRMAVLYANLTVEEGAELVIGAKGDRNSGEILVLATETCGALRVNVHKGGALRLYNSQVRTESMILSLGTCSKGYTMFVDGSLEIVDSHLSYIAGARGELVKGSAADAVIRGSRFSYCDGNALHLVDVDGSRVVVDDCDLQAVGNWGVVVRGSGGEPVEIHNSILDGAMGALMVSGEAPHVRLVDCVMGGKGGRPIGFNGTSGLVEISWTRKVKVIDAATQLPRAGVTIRAESGQGSPVPMVDQAQTDAEGVAELVLTEWIARPGSSTRQADRNVVGPYTISVTADDMNVQPRQITVRGRSSVPIQIAYAG